MCISVCAVVEGHGEVEAIGVLLRRMGELFCPETYLDIKTPIRIPKSKLIKPDELERAVELAKRKVNSDGLIFVLIDADDDCPFQLGSNLFNRARAQLRDTPVSVVLAKSEFESWFIAAAPSIADQRGLFADIKAPENAEGIRNAKGWLSLHMPPGKSYSETLDQPALTSMFDFEMARTAPSFDKFYRDAEKLFSNFKGKK